VASSEEGVGSQRSVSSTREKNYIT